MLLDPPVGPSGIAAVRDSAARIGAIARHNVKIRLRDPGQAITYFALPMILMIVLKPLYVRAVSGGAVVIATGLLVMFSVFTVGIAGNSILAERQWRTWDRLRQSPASTIEIVLGKIAPLYALMLVQQAFLFTYACLVIGIPIPHSLGLVAVSIAIWAATLLAVGVALATIARSLGELSAISDIGAMVLSSMAGALVPLSILPGWVQGAAHASPGFYALEMFRDAIHGDASGVLSAAAVLIAIAVVSGAFAIYRLRRGWGRTRLL
jgi:ABC-2 type transport system permease protein